MNQLRAELKKLIDHTPQLNPDCELMTKARDLLEVLDRYERAGVVIRSVAA